MGDPDLYEYIWLNLYDLCQRLRIRDIEEVVIIRYFSSLPYWDVRQCRDHKKYIRALTSTSKLIKVTLGRFQNRYIECHKCNRLFSRHAEKRTDVGVSSYMWNDAIENNIEVAYVISADSDYVPSIYLLKKTFSDLQVKFWFPPRRGHRCSHIRKISNWSKTIPDYIFSQCQFSNPVITKNGEKLFKPKTWIKQTAIDRQAKKLRRALTA